jgi:hypothetical protein
MRNIFTLLFLLVSFIGNGQLHYVVPGMNNRFLGRNAYDPYIQIPIGHFDIINNNRSFGRPGNQLIDGDITTSFVIGSQNTPYWPAEAVVNLNGIYNLQRIELYDVGGGGTFEIRSGMNQYDSLTVDTIITLNLNTKRTFYLFDKPARWVSLKINHTQAEVQAVPSKRNGPAEIRLYGTNVATYAIPPPVERPYPSFAGLFGLNMDVFSPPSLHAWPGTHFRAYDEIYKFQDTLPLPGTKYTWKNSFTQGLNYDAYLKTQRDAGITTLMVFPGTSRPEKLYKPSYTTAGHGSEYSSFNRAVQYGEDPEVPANYALNADFAFQYALHYGCLATDTSLAKVNKVRDPGITKVGTCISPLMELGNEEDNWFRHPREGYSPDQQAAKMSALYDGHCGTMGATFGFKQADSSFKVIMPASADFGLDYIKRIYYWCQHNRADKKFPADAINIHSYLTNGGGQFVAGAKGIAPEMFYRPGYNALGVKEYLAEFSDWVKRYLPGVEIWWTEFGYDSNPYSIVGVPLLTQAQAAVAPNPLTSHRLQAALLMRTYFEAMTTTSVDKMTMFTLSNYNNGNESVQRFFDLNESPVANWTGGWVGAPGEQFATSGLTLGQYGWVKGVSALTNVTVPIGTQITLTLDSLRPYFVFSGTVQLRDPDDAAGNGAHLYCSVVSQTQTTLVLQVGPLGPGNVSYTGTGSFSTWRIDTPYAKKVAWYAVNNTYQTMDSTMKFVADHSTVEYRDYVFSDGTTKEVHTVYLPTQSGNLLNRTINIGRNNATLRHIESRTGASTPLTVSGTNITIDITEMPKLIVCNLAAPVNIPPVALAGADQTITTTSTSFSGSGTDADGSIFSYLWTKVSGGAATLLNANTSTLSLTGLTAGSYVFRLAVADNFGATNTDDVSLTVSVSNAPPIAGPQGTINHSGSSITLYDNGSYDPDGTIASFLWTRLSGPNVPTIATPSGMNTNVTGLVNGTYVFRETITDNSGASDNEDFTVNITGVSTGNIAPTANAGVDRSISISTATISGSGTDSDGTISSYLWTKQSGGVATMSNTTTSTLSLSGLANGSYVFRLTVTDNLGATGYDEMNVTVTGVGGGGGSLTSTWVETSITDPSGSTFLTLVRLPIGYGAAGVKWPVVVFVHGEGEKATGNNAADIAKTKTAGLPKFLNEGGEIPAIAICPITGYANFDVTAGGVNRPGVATNAFAKFGVDNYSGDSTRCYLTGLSMGGATIFPSAINYPGRWAACVPINCNPQHSSLLGPVRCPMWFYSTQYDDQSSPATVHDAIHYGLNGLGNIPFTSYYTIHAGLGHTGWNQTYANTWGSTALMTGASVPDNHPHGNIFTWMFQYKIVGGVVSLY